MMTVTRETVTLHAEGISKGVAKGKLRFFRRAVTGHEPERSDTTPENELSRLSRAQLKAEKQLTVLYNEARASVGEKEAEIFNIHKMLMNDDEFRDAAENFISQGLSASAAVMGAADKISGLLAETKDEYLAARAADIRDIAARLCRILNGESDIIIPSGGEPFILCSDDLSPSETVRLDRSQLLGFVTSGGSPYSHTAILARALGIPALAGIGEIPQEYDGCEAVIDANRGSLIINPGIPELDRYAEDRKRLESESERLRALIGRPTVTKSGRQIRLYANIGSVDEADTAYSNDAEGIGLLRSEFLYLSVTDYPDEEMLFNAYRRIAEGMHGRPVVIRTLDIGADKKADYLSLPEEENPALGFRAIRICLKRPKLFKTQLRAIIRASAFGKVAIMLPMIVSAEEVRRAKTIFVEAKNELRYECVHFDEAIQFGVMIETPAAALMGESIAKEADFFSVGTNDLIQYTLAADRQNMALSELRKNNLEPVIRLIRLAADAAHGENKWIGICGELAADLSMTQKFIDMGIDEFSVSSPNVLPLREKILGCE